MSPRIGQRYIPLLKQITFCRRVHLFSDLFLFSRHWTVEHCHKHSCWNHCWLRHRETQRYSLHYCMSQCRHLTCANIHLWGMERETRWIDRRGRGSRLTRKANKERRGETLHLLCNSLSKILMSLNQFQMQTDKVRNRTGTVRHGVLISPGIAAQYWCIVRKGTRSRR